MNWQKEFKTEVANYNQMVLNHSISPWIILHKLKLRRTIARMKAELRQRELNK